jgi:Protein of unknown function (DUF3093)
VSEPGSGTEAPATQANQIRYAERLYVTWYWWPLPLLAAVILAAEVHMGYGGVRAWLPYTVLVPLTLAILWWAGRARITVGDGELRVADGRIPLALLGAVEILPATAKRKALGPHLDPAAFVVHRGWVGPLLRVRLTDPADPTPYWIFSTRHPERLAELLRAAK